VCVPCGTHQNSGTEKRSNILGQWSNKTERGWAPLFPKSLVLFEIYWGSYQHSEVSDPINNLRIPTAGWKPLEKVPRRNFGKFSGTCMHNSMKHSIESPSKCEITVLQTPTFHFYFFFWIVHALTATSTYSILKSMESLPFHLIAKIFDDLNLRDALHASHVSHGWNWILKPYLRETYSLTKFLSSFRDPGSLLQTFRRTGAILSGSRALSYFLPSHRQHTKSSDWDMFVPYPHQDVLREELLSQGCQPLIRTKPSLKPELFSVFDYRNMSNDKVQLIALTTQWNLYKCVTDFHMSVVQNFISGWGCFSIHWESTFAKRGWLAERLKSYPVYQEQVIQKMDAKGVNLVRWNERDSVKCPTESIFVVYLPRLRKSCSHAHISLEELENELLSPVQE
jgi:hypothetical protein